MLFNIEQWPVYVHDKGSDQPGSSLAKAIEAMDGMAIHDDWRQPNEQVALVNATIANAEMLRDLIYSLYLFAEVIDNNNNNQKVGPS